MSLVQLHGFCAVLASDRSLPAQAAVPGLARSGGTVPWSEESLFGERVEIRATVV